MLRSDITTDIQLEKVLTSTYKSITVVGNAANPYLDLLNMSTFYSFLIHYFALFYMFVLKSHITDYNAKEPPTIPNGPSSCGGGCDVEESTSKEEGHGQFRSHLEAAWLPLGLVLGLIYPAYVILFLVFLVEPFRVEAKQEKAYLALEALENYAIVQGHADLVMQFMMGPFILVLGQLQVKPSKVAEICNDEALKMVVSNLRQRRVTWHCLTFITWNTLHDKFVSDLGHCFLLPQALAILKAKGAEAGITNLSQSVDRQGLSIHMPCVTPRGEFFEIAENRYITGQGGSTGKTVLQCVIKFVTISS